MPPPPRIKLQTLQAVADKAGVTLEHRGSYVREIGESRWLTKTQLYRRLYARLTKGGVKVE